MENVAKGVKRVLVAPLDWGLGHATRCIPVIRDLKNSGHDVFLAGDGKIKTLLQQEFPDLPFLTIQGYHVRYAKTKWSLPGVILMQVSKILKAIRYEQRWLNQAMQQYQFDVVISDNRFGLHHPKAHSVFITHQLLIKVPLGFGEKLLQRINHHFINKFDECWVPDHEQRPFLAGELSHPLKLPKVPVKYLGPLSRFQWRAHGEDKHLLILLSGPEPQRSILEQKIWEQLKDIDQPVLLVRGLPGETSISDAASISGTASNIQVWNHLPSQQLEEAMLNASMVVSRCGYSTVMDIMALKKKSILVPTPGQTEQEYLARHLMQSSLALCVEQGQFDLKEGLSLAACFPYQGDVGLIH